MRNALRPSVIVACSVAVLCCAAGARAQSVDGSFDPGADFTVVSMAVQPDGKIIVGGGFTHLGGGGTGTTVRNHIGRLNVDGSVDSTFNPGANSIVQAIAVQPDGKILIGGNFLAVGGGTGTATTRNYLARFNADGTLDTGFNPGANNVVYSLVVQPDGKILVGGTFSKLGGGGLGTTTRNAIGRLNADGSLDGFDPGASKTGGVPIVYTMALQPDGNVVVGGYFNGLGGGTGATVRNYVGRINGDGSIDTSFNPGATFYVYALALQADGKIVAGGDFIGLGAGTGSGPGSSSRLHIGRINTDGSVDLGFNPGAESIVHTLGVQADGKILAGGYFKWLGDAGGALKLVRNYVGRINANGSIDSFDPSANRPVNAVALQGNGAIVIGGTFDRLNSSPNSPAGIVRNYIARITPTDAAVQTLTLAGNGTIETWMRSGSTPEVSRVTFEFSFDGMFYSPLGSGTRISGGWQLTTGVNLPTSRKLYIRARGYYGSGFQNGSGSIVESILVTQPGTTPGDFDGDGKADLVVFSPSTGMWSDLKSGDSTISTLLFGISTDVPVPGDYDGDGRTDIGVFRPGSGTWYVQRSTLGILVVQFGAAGDIPVPADYDGDHKTDIAVYRPSNGQWWILQSSTSTVVAVTAGAAGDVPVPADYDGDGKADLALFRPSTGEWFIRSSITSSFTSNQFGLNGDVPVPGDYDGDGKADIAIYRPTAGTWYVLESTTNFTTFITFPWGLPGDLAEPGDYDGDGRTEIAVYRPSSGTWFIRLSTTGYQTSVTTQFGLPGDTAVPGALIAYAMARVKPVASLANLTPFNDFDGDRKADITVFRPSSGTWFTLKSGANYTSTQFGLTEDMPVPGDYDGDGKADIAVFRPSSGTWFILRSSDSTFFAKSWGIATDIPVPGDYDGDGKTDVAVFRPSSGTWFILRSSDSTFLAPTWGLSTDIPVPGDYDGDGKTDVAIFRPSTGTWFILGSSAGYSTQTWGLSTDKPVPGDYDGDGKTDVAVFRPSSGTWFILRSSDSTFLAQAFGLSTDVPVPGDYDGDGKTDVAIFRPSTGTWWMLQSSTNNYFSQAWGVGTDIPVSHAP